MIFKIEKIIIILSTLFLICSCGAIGTVSGNYESKVIYKNINYKELPEDFFTKINDYAIKNGYEITKNNGKNYIRFISGTSLADKTITGNDFSSYISINNFKKNKKLELKVKITGNNVSSEKLGRIAKDISFYIEEILGYSNYLTLEKKLDGKNYTEKERILKKDSNYEKNINIINNGYKNKIAIVIGINNYFNLPKLDGAVPDANRMSQLFKDLNFNKIIRIENENATRTGILKSLSSNLEKKLSKDDLLVIYFAGHGGTETYMDSSKHGYIIPVDSDPDSIFSTAISMEKLRTVSSRLPAKHIYYIIDSCYSGTGLKRSRSINKKQDHKYIKKMLSLPVVQMITAGSEGEEAFEVNGKGIFTDNIILGIKGDADSNNDGIVTSSELGNYIRPKVTSISNSTQTPQFGTLSGFGEVSFFY